LENHTLLDAVSHLSSLDSLTARDIEDALNISLTIRQRQTTEFFIFYGGKQRRPWKSSALKSVELRTLTNKATAQGIILSLTITDNTGMDIASITRRFGVPDEVDVPGPNGKPQTSAIYIYRTPEATLKFEVAPQPAKAIHSITIERIE
jgi:hypothetical protein